MRVPTITVYKHAAYQLNRLTSDLTEANEEVSTGIAVSKASDDPSGMAQVLSIDSTISALSQTQANIQQGQNLLTGSETALDTMADLMLELNLLCSQLSNASSSAQERTDAAQSMQTYLDQILDLANTKTYGGYLFAGDENQVAPFAYDDPDNPTAVTYGGSGEAVVLKTGDDTATALNCCGCDLFYEEKILVDESNNALIFQEDPATATEDVLTLETLIPSGSYTREELARAVETAMTQASLEQGYGVTYEIGYDEAANTFSLGTDGSHDGEMTTTLMARQSDTPRISGMTVSGDYDEMTIEIINEGTLTQFTPEPEGTAPLTLTYSADDATWTLENDPGYGLPAQIEAQGNTLELDLDEDGVADIVLDLGAAPEDGTMVTFDIVEGSENNSILPDLGFDGETVSITQATGNKAAAGPFTVVAGENDTVDFIEIFSGDGSTSSQLTAVIEAGTYSDPQDYARAVETAMEAASAQNGSRVNYEVAYNEENQTFTIREDTDTGRQLESFTLLFDSGTHSRSSAAGDLGFTTGDVYSGPVEGQEASWSIFDTVLDLEQALAANDVDGIQRAMIRLENHYESLTSSIASVGRAYDNLTALAATASDTETNLTSRLSEVQDADSVTSVMVLNATQTTYEAALNASAKIMDLSLANYL